MILQFSCSNHKSIKDKILFSMLASSDSTSKNSLITHNALKILRSAVIYGANGSGKSNFINAMSYMKKLVSNSIHYQTGDKICQNPHKLSNSNSPIKEQFNLLDIDIQQVADNAFYDINSRENTQKKLKRRINDLCEHTHRLTPTVFEAGAS